MPAVLQGLLAAAFWTACCAQVAFNTPFQIVRPTANHTSLIPVAEGLAQLAQHHGTISILSVVGPYHSGKSFLLNALLENTKVFSIGRKTDPETMGLWLCRTELKATDGSEVWLLDSEGFFGPGIEESYDAKIFTIATLLGAHLVYNSVKIIDQQAVNLLEMLARRAQLFRTRSSAEAAGVKVPEFLSVRSFPPLTWVVEDFVQELPSSLWYGSAEEAANAWLNSYLGKANASSSDDAHFLRQLYSDLSVRTLFLPATTKENLQDLSSMGWGQLTKEFREEVGMLRRHVLSKLEARKFEGVSMTGQKLERAIRFIVQALQRGVFHELPSMWATWSQQVAQMSLQDAETWFANLLTNIDIAEEPVPVSQFNEEVEEARRRAVQFYRELLRDFQVNPDLTEVSKRMAAHFQTKLVGYHERIYRWVGDLIAVAKDKVGKHLMAIELPVDPDQLKQQGDKVSKQTSAGFAEKLNKFSQRGASVKLGKQALMPIFNQEPVTTLSNDLRTLVSTRELENDREILHFFKKAVAAADEAVEGELKANSNKLMGKARLKELKGLVDLRCWQAFDEQLSKYAWLKFSSHYKTHKAMVQTDTFETKFARFTSANDQRLSEHFRGTLERCIQSYKTRKGNLAMPASESEIDADHRQLANTIREMLEEQQGRELVDTDPYKSALQSLNSVMEEGYQHIRQKNVELWKVHSDEATRCALRENQAVERRCKMWCLFNKIPQVHKTTSRKHLMGCFSRSGFGSRMSPAMQEQVFENWYNKDLAQDAASVWTNFYIMSGLVGGFMVLLFFQCSRSGAPPPPPPMMQPPPPPMAPSGYSWWGGRKSPNYSNYPGR